MYEVCEENLMEEVVLYARVSSDRQDVDLSISAQLRALREYARKNGYIVVREFVDEAESGRTIKRPVFQEMIRQSRLKPPPFDGVLVWKLSRFARNREDAIVYKSLLRKQGIQVISITEPVEDTPTGRMMEGIIEVMDEFYSANLGQEVTRGMREAVSRGFCVGSSTPSYGYRRVKVQDGAKERSRLEPDPDTSWVVRKIFRMAESGMGCKEIVKSLNSDGIPSAKGKAWGKGSVHKILTNEVHTGTLVWGANGAYHRQAHLEPVRVENAFEAIIDADTFQRVNEELRSRAPKIISPRRVSSRYTLSGLISCGNCGAAMFGVGAKSGRYHYYVCATSYRNGKQLCDAGAIPQHAIEDLVVGKVQGLILQEEHITEMVRLTNEELKESLSGVESQISALDSQLTDIDERLQRLYDALETGKLEIDDLAPRIKEMKGKQDLVLRARSEAREVLDAGRVEQVSRDVVLEYLQELRGILDLGSIGEKKAFLRSFIESVEVKNSQVTLHYTLPLPLERVPIEPDRVLNTVNGGGAGGT